MASYVPAKRATEFIFYVGLVAQSNTKTLQSNPTIASGDFQVSKDGGALANLSTLPAVTPASSKMVKITLSATEMTADNVTVVCSDAAGAQWCDLIINIQTAARQIDDLAFPNTSGRGIDVDATGGVEITANQSVLITPGTGSGQLDVTSGVIKANLAQILGTALTETAGQIAAAFKQFFNIASPTSTMNLITAVTTTTTATNLTNAATNGDLTATMKTSVTTAATAATPTAAAVTGAVGSVTAGVTVTTNNDKTGYGLSAAAVQAIWDALTSALTTVGSIGKLLVDNINATISSRLASASYTAPDNSTIATINSKIGTPAGASVSADVAAVKADTAAILADTGTDGVVVAAGSITAIQSGLATAASIAALNNLSAAQVNAEVDTALADVNLDHLVGTATGIPAIPAGTFLDQIMDDGTAVYDRTTDSLQAIRDRGDAAWTTGGGSGLDAAGVRAAVGLASANLDTQLSGIQADTDNIQTRLPAALTADGNMKADALALSGDTVAADNAESFFDGTGYAGTNNVIPQVTTVTNLTNAPTAGDLTATMKTSVTTAATAATPTAAAVTGSVGSVAGNVGGNVVGSVASVTAGVTVATNNDKTGYALSAAGVDAILDEPITEPSGVFAWASATLRNIIGWQGALARNKITQTATTATLRNDADNANIATATVSDDGTTFTRGEYS